jgi:hypothetical protein
MIHRLRLEAGRANRGSRSDRRSVLLSASVVLLSLLSAVSLSLSGT